MKIVLATPIYPPEIGGPATYTKELCERIHQNHNVTVVAFTDSKEVFPGTQLLVVSKNQPLPIRLIKYFFAVWKASRGADIIYVQNAMASGLPVALVSMLRHIPFVLKFVGDEAWERATQLRLTAKKLEDFLRQPGGNLRIRLMMLIQRFVLRRANVVTTPSAYLREEIIKAYGVRPDRAITNYNASEETETTPFEGQRKKHQIVTTARLVPWKGIDGIIQAVSVLKKKFPDVKLVVAGDGPEMESLRKLIEELDLNDNVTLLGKISRTETWRLRKNSEVYVLNSTYEGLPHTVLTSFSAMIPTVATNISGTNEAVYDEKTGLLVEPGNVPQLAKAIERLFSDPELQERLVRSGAELLKEKFSWEAHIKKLESIFQSVLSKPRQ